jgi:hypothetical protein
LALFRLSARSRRAASRVDRTGLFTENTSQAVSVPCHPPVGAIGSSRERAREQGDRSAAWQQPCQVRYSLAARVDTTADDEMPGLHLPLGIDLAQEIVGLRALKCDGPQAPGLVPGQDLGQRPPTEPAVAVKEDYRVLHSHNVAAIAHGSDARVGPLKCHFVTNPIRDREAVGRTL